MEAERIEKIRIAVKLLKEGLRRDGHIPAEEKSVFAVQTLITLANDVLEGKLVPAKKEMDRERFRSIMCEHTPTIAEDSGQPEWSQGELDRLYDVLFGLPAKEDNRRKIYQSTACRFCKHFQKDCHESINEHCEQCVSDNPKMYFEPIKEIPAKETCPECKGMKKVDWHYLDGTIKMEDCPKCSGTGTIKKEVK